MVELENAFRAADKDKSGRISLEEWMEVLRASGQDVTRYILPCYSLYVCLNVKI